MPAASIKAKSNSKKGHIGYERHAMQDVPLALSYDDVLLVPQR